VLPAHPRAEDKDSTPRESVEKLIQEGIPEKPNDTLVKCATVIGETIA
jgi:hypothetical protein